MESARTSSCTRRRPDRDHLRPAAAVASGRRGPGDKCRARRHRGGSGMRIAVPPEAVDSWNGRGSPCGARRAASSATARAFPTGRSRASTRRGSSISTARSSCSTTTNGRSSTTAGAHRDRTRDLWNHEAMQAGSVHALADDYLDFRATAKSAIGLLRGMRPQPRRRGGAAIPARPGGTRPSTTSRRFAFQSRRTSRTRQGSAWGRSCAVSRPWRLRLR